ncbi:MAG: heavy metal translocating P-type ATPase [Rhodobacteraceae bacterium]|nr:heavy metal translocating P-type ATPase [Paracoccaceae bacterium]
MLDATPTPTDSITLSLPGIHCAGCIAKVERGLAQVKGVRAARVNLGRRRATIEAAAGLASEPLIGALEDLGFEAHEMDSAALAVGQSDSIGKALLLRIAVAGFALMNVMMFSFAVWFGAGDITRDVFHWLSAAIAIPAATYAAQPFFSKAVQALRVGRLNMDVPISVAIVLALGMSTYEVASGGAAAYFDAALSLTFFLLCGRYLEHRMRHEARSAAQELNALEVPTTMQLTREGPVSVAVADLRVGDIVQVAAGGRIPVDGIQISPDGTIDRSFITGESLPLSTAEGDELIAGDVSLSGPITLRATQVGDDTTLRRLAALVEVAEGARNRFTAIADRAATVYAPAVHILALAAFVGWLTLDGDIRHALNVAVAVLIITCPCALGLAVPAVATVATGRLFRAGLLVKHETALERLATVDTVVLDKTGTVTTGQPSVNTDALTPVQCEVALALAQGSAHPLSRAMVGALKDHGIRPAPVLGIAERAGRGIEGLLAGLVVRLGAPGFVGANRADEGLWLRLGEAAPVRLPVQETLRPSAVDALSALKGMGLNVHLLSGDTDAATRKMAAELGGIAWAASVSPEQKIAFVETLQNEGARVLMVGNGLNDAAALAAATASMSPASALDVARCAIAERGLEGHYQASVYNRRNAGVRSACSAGRHLEQPEHSQGRTAGLEAHSHADLSCDSVGGAALYLAA